MNGPGPRLSSMPSATPQAAHQVPVADGDEDERSDLLRRLAVVVGNIGVLTALLVYFGWVRSEVQSRNLGIDESILGMSTQEYLLRSVRPVLILLIVVAISGLCWVVLDRWLSLRLGRRGPDDRLYRSVTNIMPAALLVLPLAAWLAKDLWPAPAFVAFPLLCAAGLLLLLYSFHLRMALPGSVPLSSRNESILRACTGLLIGVAMFTTASNYATVEGTELAEAFEERVPTLPRVTVHSIEALNIDAPGVQTKRLSAEAGYKFQYTGLRFLEHTGGQYFLISDEWTRTFGVVVVLRDDEPGVRFDFVRDLR